MVGGRIAAAAWSVALGASRVDAACATDMDCAGDAICVDGECRLPDAPPGPRAAPAPPAPPAPAQAGEWWREPSDAEEPRSAAVAAGADATAECPECYAPLALGLMPFATVRSAHRIGTDLGVQYLSEGPVSAEFFTFGLDGEVAAVPRRLALGVRVNLDAFHASGFGGSEGDGALRSLEFALKGTPYDDGRGNAVAVAVKSGVTNLRSGWHADAVPLLFGLMASLHADPLDALFLVGGGPLLVIAEGDNPSLYLVQWAFQPSVGVAGPHRIALNLSGTVPIVESEFVHLADVGFGYLHAGDGFKSALMIVVPVTHRDVRGDLGFFFQFGWEG